MPDPASPLTLVTIPCRTDNYAFLIHEEATGRTALVDAPEAAPIAEALAQRGWTLDDILITHHHSDHVDGVAALRAGARVIGAAADAHRLPPLDRAVAPGETFETCGQAAHVIEVSGHTVGHIAFHLPGADLLFTGDSLMAMGCGRLFEGTPDQMWEAMQRLRALPGDPLVCSGHEYTRANMDFALTLEPANADLISRSCAIDDARAAGRPTVPSRLSEERRTNPYLRADDPVLARAVALPDAPAARIFAEVRGRKDRF